MAKNEIVGLTADLSALVTATAVNLPAKLAEARRRAEMSAVERDWVPGEEVIGLIGSVSPPDSPKGWPKVTFVRLDPDNGLQPFKAAMETRVAPTVLFQRANENLALGKRIMLMAYRGRVTGSGNEYHGFDAEALE